MSWLDDLETLPGERLSDGKRESLRTRYRIVREIRPERIIEIGVRAGYSAYAMLSAAPRASYLGIDQAAGVDGGTPETLEHARKILSRFDATIRIADSQAMKMLPKADLIHIDGDHTLVGCMHDLELARKSGIPWAVVDDVALIRDVRKATKAFVLRHNLHCQWLDDGHHGTALIRF